MLLKKTLKKKLIEINDALDENSKNYNEIGLLTGLSGIILFKFYYAQFLNDEKYAVEGFNLINRCVEGFESEEIAFTYCDGIAGMGWVLDHLEMEGFIESNNDLLFSELDPLLYDRMTSNLNEGNFDFLHGAIGIASYFLNRYRNSKQTDFKKRYKDYLLVFIKMITETSEQDDSGNHKWISIVDHKTQKKAYNLSLAHGITSILAFFTKLHKHSDFQEKCEPILRSISNYILKNENENHMYQFPASISRDGTKQNMSRLAWCYGDLGIGLQLWYTAQSLNDSVLEKKAISVLEYTTKQREASCTNIVDASICHGSFGVAQIFNQLFHQTKNTLFQEAALFWMQDGLRKANHTDGFAGYKQWRGNTWENEISLLEGISGIGLVIIDYLSEERNTWDESFMIS